MEIYEHAGMAVYSKALRSTGSERKARALSVRTFGYLWANPQILADSRVPVELRLVVLTGRLAGEPAPARGARPWSASRGRGRHRRSLQPS